ncbi:protein Flattop [Strix uralensis]|uniref:protein Flattop n=1 Tax=Strix uralensis TaxID=36305 RepID=UPI003DA6DD2D
MAARYGAGQYEDAFSSRRLQNWSVPRPGRQRPSLREGSTQIIADDRGHLLPTVPRSQASPWGTFVGTWEMPLRIPPARLDLTSRSAAAAARLLGWIHQPTTLTRARNGLWTEITGKPQELRWDTQTTTEPSRRSSRASSEGVPPAGAALEEPPGPGAGAAARLPRQPSAPKADASPERLRASPDPGRPGPRDGARAPTSLLGQTDAGTPARPWPPTLRARPLLLAPPRRGSSAEAEPRGGRAPGSGHPPVRDGERPRPEEAP